MYYGGQLDAKTAILTLFFCIMGVNSMHFLGYFVPPFVPPIVSPLHIFTKKR